MELPPSEIPGLVGGALITFGLIPQIVRVLKLRSAREISLLFTLLFLSGAASWLLYGFIHDLFSVKLWNGIALALTLLLLQAKLKFGR